MSSLRALFEVIGERGLFCSLYADRASHYWHTPDAGGKVDKDNPTQVGRALQRLGIELIAAYSPEARGRSERMFGTLQKRLPQELRLAGITGSMRPTASSRRSICPNTTPASPPRPRTRAPPSSPSPARSTTSCASTRNAPSLTTTPCATSAGCCSSPPTATAATTSRPRSGCTSIPTARSPSSTDPDAWPATRPAASPSTPQPGRPRDPLRRDRPGPVDKWTAAQRLTTSPQAQQHQQKRSTHMVHKPVNSECSRHCLIE